MNDIIANTLKEWYPKNWKRVYAEVEDTKCIQQRLIGMIRRCMSADDYELFSLSVRAVNDLIDEETAESKFEDYLDSYDADEDLVDFDILCEGLPLSRFHINYQKFITLVNERYGWIFQHSLNGAPSNSAIIPDESRDCDSYISNIAFEIHLRWEFIKSSIVVKHRESIISEATAIFNQKWEDISTGDYEKAIEMLRSVNAYNELIHALREWIYIKSENGWKIKRSDKIEALCIEEEATIKGGNVTLENWVDLYEYDYDSAINSDNTKIGILEAFYKERSGMAALILGDIYFEMCLAPIKYALIDDPLSPECRTDHLNSIIECLRMSESYYKEAALRGCSVGYMAQALIYRILGQTVIADTLEEKFKKSSYDSKRVSFNLLRDYKKSSEYKERMMLINNNLKDEDGEPCYNWLTSLPLSLMALDIDNAKKSIYNIFRGIKMEIRNL